MKLKNRKVRIYKTPSKKENSKVYVGIPDEIKLSPDITSLSVTQVEILPKPKTFTDLKKIPKVISRPKINAFKSVQKTLLDPGHKLIIKPVGKFPLFLQRPFEVEEIVLPKGFVHLEDISDWEIFNYNRTWHLTDRSFETLPGESLMPLNYRYELIRKQDTFYVTHDWPIDDVKIYFRRLEDTQEQFEWVDWISLSKSQVSGIEFPYDGSFEFRVVPRHRGKPLPYYYDVRHSFEEKDTLAWSSLQINSDTYKIRLEGQIGNQVNELIILENNKSLGTFRLHPNEIGRIEMEIDLTGVSNSMFPKLEMKFYRNYIRNRSFCFKDYYTLERNYSNEPIEMRVKSITPTSFTVYIEDLFDKMYTPDNSISPFEGSQWETACQTQKIISSLEIIRHQDGETTNYGTYYINITGEVIPNFLQAPPFTDKVSRVDKGFQFEFEDTQKFRDIANLSSPESDKRLAYEFRLTHWTAGVEECLRSREEYRFLKMRNVLVRNEKATYEYSYSTWEEEHPRRKYAGVIPVNLQYSYLNDHVVYGRSIHGIILDAQKIPTTKTDHINLKEGEWKVLYYYNEEQDELQKFPYYSFDIEVPTSSQRSIKEIKVEIETGENDVHLGTYHPSDVISVVDFLGYYESRKSITKMINFLPAFEKFDDVIQPRKQLIKTKPKKKIIEPRKKSRLTKEKAFRSIPLITPKQVNESKKTNMFINRRIAKVLEVGELKYNIVIYYHGTSIPKTRELVVQISDIPKEPPEPSNNLSMCIGNKTIRPKTFKVPKAIGKLLVNQVKEISPKKVTKISRKPKIKGFRR